MYIYMCIFLDCCNGMDRSSRHQCSPRQSGAVARPVRQQDPGLSFTTFGAQETTLCCIHSGIELLVVCSESHSDGFRFFTDSLNPPL